MRSLSRMLPLPVRATECAVVALRGWRARAPRQRCSSSGRHHRRQRHQRHPHPTMPARRPSRPPRRRPNMSSIRARACRLTAHKNDRAPAPHTQWEARGKSEQAAPRSDSTSHATATAGPTRQRSAQTHPPPARACACVCKPAKSRMRARERWRSHHGVGAGPSAALAVARGDRALLRGLWGGDPQCRCWGR
jgi:hypothetical protein